jgi:hypothetical protein
MTEHQLQGIHPEQLYAEQELRKHVEISALRRAKREGMPWCRIGRQVWMLGGDVIQHFVQKKQ